MRAVITARGHLVEAHPHLCNARGNLCDLVMWTPIRRTFHHGHDGLMVKRLATHEIRDSPIRGRCPARERRDERSSKVTGWAHKPAASQCNVRLCKGHGQIYETHKGSTPLALQLQVRIYKCGADIPLAYTLCMTMAIPCPPPIHIVINPYCPPIRCNSYIVLITRMVPVAPIGWPKLIPEPFTLVLD